ncbi:MAG: hypothetical protein GPJ54_12285 [Candidatus Heimdallarchaeota archaeon]|nr:hypothetical protein [Candidatus Heimdallarchaeota archaeon]
MRYTSPSQMKKFGLYYIFVGIILTVFGIGIIMIIYGLYLYNKGRKWDNQESQMSYSDPEQYQAIEDHREGSKQYGKPFEKTNYTGADINQLGDEELYGLFRQRYYKGRNYIIIGLLLSVILIGIPIVVFGFIEISKSVQVKTELKRRGVMA